MAVGTHKGYVQIWDASAGKKLSVLEGHTARVGEWRSFQQADDPAFLTQPPLHIRHRSCSAKFLHWNSFSGALAWNADQLSSGSRDRVILQRDIRAPPLQSERRLQGHRQEVCGLKWSTDHQLLASGGNDNKVCSSGGSAPLSALLWSESRSVTSLCFSPGVAPPPGCSCLCGTTQVSSQCSSTQST